MRRSEALSTIEEEPCRLFTVRVVWMSKASRTINWSRTCRRTSRPTTRSKSATTPGSRSSTWRTSTDAASRPRLVILAKGSGDVLVPKRRIAFFPGGAGLSFWSRLESGVDDRVEQAGLSVVESDPAVFADAPQDCHRCLAGRLRFLREQLFTPVCEIQPERDDHVSLGSVFSASRPAAPCFSTTIKRSFERITRSTSGSSCPARTMKWVGSARTNSYSPRVALTLSEQARLSHSHKYCIKGPSCATVWLSVSIRSLTLRKSSSFLACASSRIVALRPWSLTGLDRLKRDFVAVRAHPNIPEDGFGAGQLHCRLRDLVGPEAVGDDDALTAQ